MTKCENCWWYGKPIECPADFNIDTKICKNFSPKNEKEVYEYINSIEKWCQLCGSPHNLQRHHIRYGREGRKTYIGNVIVLCQRCHQRVHSNKRIWQPTLIELDKRARGVEDV
jgi:5-methylcytosine-specific restriction endonuclease McrA